MPQIINILYLNFSYKSARNCVIHHTDAGKFIETFNCNDFIKRIESFNINDIDQIFRYDECIMFYFMCFEEIHLENDNITKFTKFFGDYIFNNVTDEQVLGEVIGIFDCRILRHRIADDIMKYLINLYLNTKSKKLKKCIMKHSHYFCSRFCSRRCFNYGKTDKEDDHHKLLKIILSDDLVYKRQESNGNEYISTYLANFIIFGCNIVGDYILERITNLDKFIQSDINKLIDQTFLDQIYNRCHENMHSMQKIFYYIINNESISNDVKKINNMRIQSIIYWNENIPLDMFINVINNLDENDLKFDLPKYELFKLVDDKVVPLSNIIDIMLEYKNYSEEKVLFLYDKGLKLSEQNITDITTKYNIILPSNSST